MACLSVDKVSKMFTQFAVVADDSNRPFPQIEGIKKQGASGHKHVSC